MRSRRSQLGACLRHGRLAPWSTTTRCRCREWFARQAGLAQGLRWGRCEKASVSWAPLVFVGRCHGDDAERAVTAVGAASGIASGEAPIEVLPRLALSIVGLRRRGRMEKLSCSRDEPRAAGVGLETEVSDTDEAVRDDVEKESLDEIRCGERESLSFVAPLSIAVAEGHQILVESHQPLVPHGDPMGIPAQIPKHLRRPCHGCFAVDHPLLRRRLAYQPASKRSAHA